MQETYMPAWARALRHFSAFGFFVCILSLMFIACSHDYKLRSTTSNSLSFSERALIETFSSRTRIDSLRRKSIVRTQEQTRITVDVETQNLTIIVENLESYSDPDDDSPWMFTLGGDPFTECESECQSVHANSRIRWNANGAGNGSCRSGDSGRKSHGYLDPFNYYLGLATPPNFDNVEVKLDNFSLTHFTHINVLNGEKDWNITGEAGDSRRYEHGTLDISIANQSLLSATNVQWIQNLSYPRPAGPAPEGTFDIGGYFVGELVENKTEPEWLGILDPFRMGYVLGIFSAASFGPSACYSKRSLWVSLRSFPDPKSPFVETAVGTFGEDQNQSSGIKSGVYKGSSESQIAAAQDLASVGKAGVTTSVSAAVGSAVASAAVAVVAPGAVAIPPGQAVSRLVRTAAFVAKINEVPGFHSDAMMEFGESLSVFLGKFESPFGSNDESSAGSLARVLGGVWSSVRQDSETESESEEDDDEDEDAGPISDDDFTGCAFYTSVVVFGFLLIHLIIWLVTRKRALKDQLPAHAWMIYLFSIVMSYVFTAAVLNAAQYMRSHVGRGTGKPGFYVLAAAHLMVIGGGFTVFFLLVVYHAHQRIQRKEVKWVPRAEVADPDARREAFVIGQYEAEDDNAFHTLFECYYTSLCGPRLWIAAIEMCVILVDAIITAVVWNEVVCLAVLVCVYALLFTIFLTLAPFVDKIEGSLVVLLGLVELLMLLLEFLGALGDFATAEKMEFAGLILGFIAIGIAVVMALYGDIIPTLISLWRMARRKLLKRRTAEDGEGEKSTGSTWSGLSSRPSWDDVAMQESGSRESVLEY